MKSNLEVACRKLLLKRLQTPMNTLERARAKEVEESEKRIASLTEYQAPEEAHEAFGYGYISEDEYRKVCDYFKDGEQISSGSVTETGAAIEILSEFISRLEGEIRYFEWEALPKEEKARIEASNEAWREERRKWRESRGISDEAGV